MSKPWIFICPSSRGIGHALTAHLLRHTTLPILATARSADLPAVKESLVAASSHGAQEEKDLEDAASRLHMTRLDVTDEASVETAAAEAAALFPPSSHHLHLAFAVPGILRPEKHPRTVDYEAALETFRVNTLGPLLLMKWFGDMLPRKGTDLRGVDDTATTNATTTTATNGDDHETRRFRVPPHATWLTASARVGSISDNSLGGWYSYRASKAGVNSLTKSFDVHLRARCGAKAMAVAYHPGTVKTGLSKEFWGRVDPDKLFSPEFAAMKMLEVVGTRTVGQRGRCWDWKGEEVLP
ncbi:short-chain dehydrogenase/reductase-like protein [Xylaria cf. heliscus]|nr:short-chain dehydrogenase/reductase-like protein [Xylaria cf. heliscus]